MRKLTPLTAGLYNVQHGVCQFALAPLPIPHSRIQWLYFFPLAVCQVRRVRLAPCSYFFHAAIIPRFTYEDKLYVLPTFLIKGLVALVAWKLCRKDQPLLALLSFLLAEAVMVLGYFLLEWALYGVASAAAAIGPNVVQGIAGVLIGMLCLLITPRLERVAKL